MQKKKKKHKKENIHTITLPPGARSSYVAYYIRDQMTHPRWYHCANHDLANSVLRMHLLLMISMAGLSYLR